MKYILILAIMFSAPSAFAQSLLGHPQGQYRFDSYPGELDGPGLLHRRGIEVETRAVVLQNTSNGVMHFSADGVNFDINAKSAKKIVLPNGEDSIILTYSIEGQKKQITVAGGHLYALYFDVSNRLIVAIPVVQS